MADWICSPMAAPATNACISAGAFTAKSEVKEKARKWDIKLIEYHMVDMNEVQLARAEKTIAAIKGGNRRYDDQLPDIGEL